MAEILLEVVVKRQFVSLLFFVTPSSIWYEHSTKYVLQIYGLLLGFGSESLYVLDLLLGLPSIYI